MNWFIKKAYKKSKKLDLWQTLKDIEFLKVYFAEYINADEAQLREDMAKLDAQIRKLQEIKNPTDKIKEDIIELMVKKSEANDFINGIVLYTTQLKKLCKSRDELTAYIEML